MESGTLMLRHILTINRMMFHHHILTTNEDETLMKMYLKQKSDPTKDDWYQLLQNDFQFLGLQISDEEIRAMPKKEYKKKIKSLVRKAAFDYFLKEKQHHSKLNDVKYCEFKLQPYLKDQRFSKEERILLTSLRSRCHSAKINFRKLHRSDLTCRLGCDLPESQFHIFTECKYGEIPPNQVYESIFSDETSQKEVIQIFIQIEKRRLKLLQHVPPGDARARAQDL